MSDNNEEEEEVEEVEETYENNALHTAVIAGNLAEVQAQVSNFDINAKGENGRTSLYFAANAQKPEVVKLLLTLGVDVNLADVSIPTMISGSYDVHFLVPYIYTIPSFLPLPTCVDITCSRCTTFTFYNST